MAFTGVAVVEKIADGLVRIMGLSLALGASGTIGLANGGGQVDMPEGCGSWAASDGVSLISAVQVQINPAADLEGFSIPIRVVKTGVSPADFLITLTMDAAAGDFSPQFEIYIRFH